MCRPIVLNFSEVRVHGRVISIFYSKVGCELIILNIPMILSQIGVGAVTKSPHFVG